MRNRTKAGIALASVLAAGAGAAGIATAGGDDDATDTPLKGSALQQASDAALAETGGGTVSGTEIDDEESYYEVEVTRDDGSQVDVQLDRGFNVVGSEDESGGEDD